MQLQIIKVYGQASDQEGGKIILPHLGKLCG
jgi:hypothetical protein